MINKDFTLEWMEKAKKNCIARGAKDSAALWGDAISILKQQAKTIEKLKEELAQQAIEKTTNYFLHKHIKKLTDCVKFYANESNWEMNDYGHSPATSDEGERARQCLKEIK